MVHSLAALYSMVRMEFEVAHKLEMGTVMALKCQMVETMDQLAVVEVAAEMV